MPEGHPSLEKLWCGWDFINSKFGFMNLGFVEYINT